MKNKRCPGNIFIKIFESFLILVFVAVAKHKRLKVSSGKEMKWTERKGGALDRVQCSTTRRLTKLSNLFFFTFNKLVNNTPPLPPNPPPLFLKKKGRKKVINKCRGKDDPGYISVWIFYFILFFSSSSRVWFWHKLLKVLSGKRNGLRRKEGILIKGKLFSHTKFTKLTFFFFWNVHQARKWHHFQGNNKEFMTCYFLSLFWLLV